MDIIKLLMEEITESLEVGGSMRIWIPLSMLVALFIMVISHLIIEIVARKKFKAG